MNLRPILTAPLQFKNFPKIKGHVLTGAEEIKNST